MFAKDWEFLLVEALFEVLEELIALVGLVQGSQQALKVEFLAGS